GYGRTTGGWLSGQRCKGWWIQWVMAAISGVYICVTIHGSSSRSSWCQKSTVIPYDVPQLRRK
ncbi:unnamed protein product, partial [Musa acuminata subsp. burmannicoides]